MTALKATKLAEEHNFDIRGTEGFDLKLPVVIKLTPKSWKTAHQLSLPL